MKEVKSVSLSPSSAPDSTAFPLGSLVQYRDRDWIVQSLDSQRTLYTLRPLVGSDIETTTVFWPLARKTMRAAQWPPLNPDQAGDFVSGALLRDAARIAIRQPAGPFRALGQCAVRPRPYQLVPLMMALRLNPVRLLIADDVGVGKTIEAGLIAKELLVRGSAQRVAVLCPPQLCEQWQTELATKFHIEAPIVRGSTLRSLEQALPSQMMSVFGYYPHLIISIDFIKNERHREAFVAACPDLVIVDEAHGVADVQERATSQQQRHALVQRLATRPDRHLVFLTATPHSGIQGAFASLMGLLDPDLGTLLATEATLGEGERARLAQHLVQRRRADVTRWLGEETPFPTRASQDVGYRLTPTYKRFFEDVWAFTRELVQERGEPRPRQRVRYWAALALLRSLMSSPQAAVEALSRRENRDGYGEWNEALELYRQREILDVSGEESPLDAVPDEALEAGLQEWGATGRRRVAGLRRQAEALLQDGQDAKLAQLVNSLQPLLQEGYHPIIFCRFVATAHYVGERLRTQLPSSWAGLKVISVTGEMPDEERAHRVAELTLASRRILVATDCLSEGIDLQNGFDAVIHYDLPWNPNRLEQREGRVDRYGQPRAQVKTVLLYGTDNPIDGAVLQVLVRKARAIYRSLGITVPVPVDSEGVIQALVQYFFHAGPTFGQLQFDFAHVPEAQTLHIQWDRAAERERESRSRFAHHALSPEAVAQVWQETESLMGSPAVVQRFLERALRRWNIPVDQGAEGPGVLRIAGTAFPQAGTKPAAEWITMTTDPHGAAAREIPVLDRTHPWVVGWAQRVLATALANADPGRVARTGVLITDTITLRTVLAIARIRYRIQEGTAPEQFAEEIVVTGYQRGHPACWHANHEDWLRWADTTRPTGNVDGTEERDEVLQWALGLLHQPDTRRATEQMVQARAQRLQATYHRLRGALGGPRTVVAITPYLPDWLGVYVLVPGGMR